MTREMIAKIVKASGVRAGELVLVHFWGEDADKEIANRFVAAVAGLGATPVLLQQSRSVNQAVFSAARESCFDERCFELLSSFDAVLDVFAYQPIVLGAQLEEKQMALYRKYVSRLFYKLMECKRFAQIRIPTEANAAESGLEPQEYVRRMKQAYDIDYELVKANCKREAERLSRGSRAVLRTGADCVLQFDLTGRDWHIDAGDGDLPCGEIYIAPVESTTSGSVFFETFYLEDVKYCDVILQVANGEVCGSSHEQIARHFARLPRENRMVGELGLGMNPNVVDLCGYPLLDEKMAGTFHIGVGANYMFGGTNQANDHIDFVGRGELEMMESWNRK